MITVRQAMSTVLLVVQHAQIPETRFDIEQDKYKKRHGYQPSLKPDHRKEKAQKQWSRRVWNLP